MARNDQSILFKGVYEFEDPSGVLVAAKIPVVGSIDLYSGSTIVVKSNQCALFMYKGKIADVLMEGTHSVKTENFPILTRLANWKFGFESPLRCEVWFFSSTVYANRRWGTSNPVIHDFIDYQAVPIRAHGIFNVIVQDPKKVFMTLVGNRTSYDISELEGFVQAQITEMLPKALSVVKNLKNLNKSQGSVAKALLSYVNEALDQFGVALLSLQVVSLIPSKEILEALDASAAMTIIGNKQDYLLYKAANSLAIEHGPGQGKGSSDSMQLMMGLMLGKSILDSKEKEKPVLTSNEEKILTIETRTCDKCKAVMRKSDRFCSSCGSEVK